MDPVDLSLVLAFDCSASVTYDEFGLIAGGLARAFRDRDIIAGLTGGPTGASQCALLLWSGRDAQEVMIDWTRIATAEDATGFADAIDNLARAVRAGLTAIGAALIAALELLGSAPARTARQVVDVVGDGRSNDGPRPGPVRDRMAAIGITINGLCVLHEEADLLENYQLEVIGGPGSFALTCPDYAAFAEAMRQKLKREADNRLIS